MNYQLQEVRTPVREFSPPQKKSFNAANFTIRHSLVHRYIDATTVEVLQLEHTVTIIDKTDEKTILKLVVECYYIISGVLSVDDEVIMNMINDSFKHLNEEYFALLNGHPLSTYEIIIDVDFEAFIDEIKQHKRSSMN